MRGPSVAESLTLERAVQEVVCAGASPARKAHVVLLQTQSEAAGAQEISRILGRGLDARGYDVHHAFCFRRTAAFDHQPNTVFCANERPRSVIELTRMFRALVAHLKELRPDALVCFQHYGNIIGTVAAHRAGVETVIVNRNSSKELIPRWVNALDLAFGMTGRFQRVIVNSASVESEYAAYPARYRKALVRIDHGFEPRTSRLDRSQARRFFGLPEDAWLLGSVGRLHPTKNIEAAIRLLPGRNWHLAVAGQGPARDELVAAARAAGVLERVQFVSELSPERVGDFLAALDVFVFPSKAETFGLAAVEAAQFGVPLVANDLEVLREVLSVGRKPCALFVDADDKAAFAAAVERLMEDSHLRRTMTAQARGLSQRYCIDTMVERYAAVIDATIARNRSRARLPRISP